MNDELLGRLERVDLRTVWTSEPAGFTPWLAQVENLEILADTLGIELELEAQEKEVGPFPGRHSLQGYGYRLVGAGRKPT